MSQKPKIVLKNKKSADERQNECFKKMSSDTKLKVTFRLVELCLKLNKLAKSYDPGRITH